MMSELELRKWYESTKTINANMEEVASFLSPNGTPQSPRYTENKIIELVLARLLGEGTGKKTETP